jgi:hypothetical protein
MVLSEIMTILIHFHQSHYRDFKAFYWLHVCRHLAGAFPQRLSYNRLVAVIPTALVPLCVYLQTRKGQATGISFIDATSLVVCHNRVSPRFVRKYVIRENFQLYSSYTFIFHHRTLRHIELFCHISYRNWGLGSSGT